MESMMKKTFITILSIFYLVSVIGFASVHRYCSHSAGKMHSPEMSERCCVHSEIKSPTKCELPEITTGSCCAVTMDSRVPTRVAEKTKVNCCKIQHQYTKVDSPSYPPTVDFSQVADRSSKELVHYPQTSQTPDGWVLTSTDPSTHINLPLLI